MWKANKKGIICLVSGLLLLGCIHYGVTPHNEQLADQILAIGFCLLLFGTGLATWLSTTSQLNHLRDNSPEDNDGNNEPNLH